MERVTLSTGVVLELRPPSPWAFVEAQRQIAKRKPNPPTTFNEAKGREEPNENDPSYAVALGQWERDLVEQLYEVGVITGSAIAEPETLVIPGPDSEDLDDLLSVLRIEPAKSEKARYLQWLKYMGAPTQEDINTILVPLLRMMGTLEADVALATESFRGGEGRATDNGNRAQRRHPERDRIRAGAPRPSSNVRGT